MIIQEKIFSQKELDRILSWRSLYKDLYATPSDEHIDAEKNYVGVVYDHWAKTFKCFNIPRTEETQWLFQKLLDWFSERTGIKTKDYSNSPFEDRNKELLLTLQGYDSGDRFDKHVDIQPGAYSDRLYNIGVQLNDDYEGGEFVIWNEKDEEKTFDKIAGTAVAYDIRFWHQVKPVTQGTRWSIVFPVLKYYVLTKRVI